jgi:hypothetical protein
MCSIAAGPRLLAAALVLGISTRAVAQDQRELLRRIETSLALSEEAARTAARMGAVEFKSRGYTDTILTLRGSVQLLTTPDLKPMVVGAAAKLDSMLLPHLHADLDLVRGTMFTVRVDTTWKRINGTTYVIIARYVTGGGEAHGGGFIPPTSDAIGSELSVKVQQIMISGASPVFTRWHNGPAPLDTTAAEDWTAVRFDLITSGTVVGKNCYAGEMTACALFLGMQPVDDPPTAWFDSAGRRARVVSDQYWMRRLNALGTERCKAGSDSACLVVLRAVPRRPDAPAGGTARTTFVKQAFAIGGTDAATRLIHHRGTLAEAIGAAAGVPLDSVLKVWHGHVVSDGTESEDFTPVIALISIGWVVVLWAVAAMGSGRWR